MFFSQSSAQVRAFAALFTGIVSIAAFTGTAQAQTHHRRHAASSKHIDRSSHSRASSALHSRGVTSIKIPASEVVIGSLGVVTDDAVPIVASREQYGRLLSHVDKGTNLTVTGQTDTYYAVMMIDRSVGFIPKDKVQLLDYKVTMNQTLASGDQAGPLGQSLIQSAVQLMGVPYIYGGETTSGIDCSAFVKTVYESNGLTLPRTAAEQASVGYAVSTTDVSQWIPGDRIYFQCHHSYIDHAGMYIGNGYFIHSSIGNHGVAVTRVDNTYYWNHIAAVRRSPQLARDTPVPSANISVQSADAETSQR